DAHVVSIILRRDPEAKNFCAGLLDDILWRHDVAGRFRHLFALPVQHEPVGQYSLVGSTPIGDDARQQGAVEPSPMLIGAFEEEIGRPPLAGLEPPSVTDA